MTTPSTNKCEHSVTIFGATDSHKIGLIPCEKCGERVKVDLIPPVKPTVPSVCEVKLCDHIHTSTYCFCQNPKPCPVHDKPNEVKHLVEVCECKCHTSGKGACLDCAQHDDDCTQKDKPCDGACTRGEFCSVHHTCFFKGFSCPKAECEHTNTFTSKSTRKGTRKICHDCNEVLPKQAKPQQEEASWEERFTGVLSCSETRCDGSECVVENVKSFIRTEIAQAEKRGEVRALEELIDDIDDKFVWAGDSHATSGGFEWLNKALTELIELIGRRIATLKAKTDI